MITLHEKPSPEHPAGRTLKVETDHIHPPIPTVNFDWAAYVVGYEKPVGFGATEAEAVQDLLEEIELDDIEWEKPA